MIYTKAVDFCSLILIYYWTHYYLLLIYYLERKNTPISMSLQITCEIYIPIYLEVTMAYFRFNNFLHFKMADPLRDVTTRSGRYHNNASGNLIPLATTWSPLSIQYLRKIYGVFDWGRIGG